MKKEKPSTKPRKQLEQMIELHKRYPSKYSLDDIRYFKQKLERTLAQERRFR